MPPKFRKRGFTLMRIGEERRKVTHRQTTGGQMGYTTTFKGELRFTSEPIASKIALISSMLEEDCREHPEWGSEPELGYIDLEFTDDFMGLRWNGAEKTYDMPGLVNVVTKTVRKQWPEFGLTGGFVAQGEEPGDIWQLVINGEGLAERIEVAPPGAQVECPDCGHRFCPMAP